MTYKDQPNLHKKGKLLYYVKKRNKKREWLKVGTIDNEIEAMDIYRRLVTAETVVEEGTVHGMAEHFRRMLLNPRNPLKLRPKTIKEYLKQLKSDGRLLLVFGNLPVESVRPIHIGKYLEKHPAPVAANREIAILSRMYSYSIERGYDIINPCLRIRRNIEVHRDRYIQDWEFAAVRNIVNPPVKVAMDLSYLTGLRMFDVLSIQVNHYDAEYLRAYEHKTATNVRIKMHSVLFSALEQHKILPGNKQKFAHIVRNRFAKGYTADGFGTMWGRGMDKALAKKVIFERFTYHDIRAKHGTDKDEKGLNVQLALGHTDPAMSKRYIRHPLGRIIQPLESLPKGGGV